jgi:hypothetical protein
MRFFKHFWLLKRMDIALRYRKSLQREGAKDAKKSRGKTEILLNFLCVIRAFALKCFWFFINSIAQQLCGFSAIFA